MVGYPQDKKQLLSRLKRIEGQIRGIQRMLEEEKYCVDVFVQISSVQAAMQKVGLIILENHVKGCVKNALARGHGEDSVNELVEVIQRYLKTNR
ncbi:MAG: metal-sensitive transcriptional regulator [Actinomycetota bacterium]